MADAVNADKAVMPDHVIAKVGLALIAARQFITNGIEHGYIRMPDADTRDSAHETLPMIQSAIAALSNTIPSDERTATSEDEA